MRDFYSPDDNRYHCHCAQTEYLLDDGKPSLTARLRDSMGGELAR